jgi:hypothetical protein
VHPLWRLTSHTKHPVLPIVSQSWLVNPYPTAALVHVSSAPMWHRLQASQTRGSCLLPQLPCSCNLFHCQGIVTCTRNHSQEMIPHFRTSELFATFFPILPPLTSPACELPRLEDGEVVPNVVGKVACSVCCLALSSTRFLSHPSASLTNGVVYTLMRVFAVTSVVRAPLTPGMQVGALLWTESLYFYPEGAGSHG